MYNGLWKIQSYGGGHLGSFICGQFLMLKFPPHMSNRIQELEISMNLLEAKVGMHIMSCSVTNIHKSIGNYG
jgi:hypothetical protein